MIAFLWLCCQKSKANWDFFFGGGDGKNYNLPKGEFCRNILVLKEVWLERFLRNRVKFLSRFAHKVTDILIFPMPSACGLACQHLTSPCKCLAN